MSDFRQARSVLGILFRILLVADVEYYYQVMLVIIRSSSELDDYCFPQYVN